MFYQKCRTKLLAMIYLRAKFVNSRRLSIVEPCIVKHQTDIINILPWVGVLASLQLPSNSWQVYWVFHDIKIVLCKHKIEAKWQCIMTYIESKPLHLTFNTSRTYIQNTIQRMFLAAFFIPSSTAMEIITENAQLHIHL